MTLHEKKILLWDLDGTLTDPALGITNSVQYALRAFGIEEPVREKLYPFIGPPLMDSFRQFYGFSKEEAARAVTVYREYFAETGIFENCVYPGIPDLLQTLTECGRVNVLATSKPTVFARRILDHFGLTPWFTLTVGSNLDGTRAGKAQVIACALEQLGSPVTDTTVMIGDRHFDVQGAREAGLDAIGVAYGYGTRQELEDAGAAAVADTVSELRRLLLG